MLCFSTRIPARKASGPQVVQTPGSISADLDIGRLDMITASRAQTSLLALLASGAVFPLPSAAQPGPAPASQAEREIVITGAADAPPAVYCAPGRAMNVSFDAPVKKDGLVPQQGAEVRPNPYDPNAVIITPSRLLTAQTPILVSVPLEDGVAVLTLAFSPARRDMNVRIVRRASSDLPAAAKGEQELARVVTETAFETCANADGTAVPRRVAQGKDAAAISKLLVCGGGVYAYMLHESRALCGLCTGEGAPDPRRGVRRGSPAPAVHPAVWPSGMLVGRRQGARW